MIAVTLSLIKDAEVSEGPPQHQIAEQKRIKKKCLWLVPHAVPLTSLRELREGSKKEDKISDK